MELVQSGDYVEK